MGNRPFITRWLRSLMLFLAVGCARLSAQETTPESSDVLRSGCEFDYPPYCIVNEKNEAGGFSVELLKAALQSMGRKVDFIVGPWSEIKQTLIDGRTQVLPLVGRTPEREAVYDFTFPYLTMHGTIVVRADNQSIRSLADLKTREVAVLRGDNAEEFLRRDKVSNRIILTDSFERALLNLSQGKYDAVVIQRLLALQLIQKNRLQNLKTVGPPLKAFRQSFCFAVQEGNHELLALLNEGLSLVIADGTFRHLYTQYFGPIEAQAIQRSRIVIGGDQDYPPYEFLDPNGKPTGYAVELTQAIAEEIGLQVDIRLKPWSETRQDLAERRIDAIQSMFYSYERDKQFEFSPPHTRVHHVIARRKDTAQALNLQDLAGRAVVVMKSDIMHELLLQQNITAAIATTSSQEEALQKLAAGQYDYALVARVPALYWIQKHGWGNLILSQKSFRDAECSYAVPHGPMAGTLIARFNEGLQTLKANGRYKAIQDRWLGVYEERPLATGDVLRKAGVVIGPLVLLLLLTLLWSRLLRRQVRLRTSELQESQATLKTAMDQSQAGILIADAPSGKIRYVNEMGLQILGQPESSPKQTSIRRNWTLYTLDHQPLEITQTPLTRAITDGQTIHEELLLKPAIGKERLLLVRAAPIYNSQGSITAGIVVFLDITEQRHLEERLRQSEKLEAIGQLAGGVAHDFNNQLGGIMGYANLLVDRLEDEKYRSYAQQILKASEHSAGLTRQLLAYARKGQYENQRLNMHELIESTIDMLEHSIDKRIDIEKKLSAPSAWVVGDSSQLQNALLNLCLNARDAMPDGGRLTITTALHRQDPAEHVDLRQDLLPKENYLKINICDTGCGMDSDVLSHIFEPFFTTKEVGKGTGMGLAAAYGTVIRHGGTMRAESRPGQGCCITFYLPHYGAANQEDVEDSKSLRALKPHRILVIEDEDIMRELIQDFLTHLGYQAVTAENGAAGQALFAAEQQDVDLVILDMMMPKMGGTETFMQLRTFHPTIPILIVSGFAIDGEAQRLLNEPNTEFLQKPFQEHELSHVVLRLLARSEAGELMP